ncbi:MAG: sugar ABC transporter permease [Tepidisphaeraceae bacterium]
MNPRLLKTAFVAPTLLFLLALNVFPLVYNIGLSFTDTHLAGRTSNWIGTDNYHTVFTDDRFAGAMRTTAAFVVTSVSIELVLGFVLALCLQRAFRGKPVVLTLLLIPMMLPPAVMGLYWQQILDGSYGLLNHVLRGVGVNTANLSWLTEPSLKFPAIVLIDVWMWTPFCILVSLAGLNAIPTHLYEAAEIDRASAWTVFRRITLPLCLPLLGLTVLLRATDALKQFDLVMALTGSNDSRTQTVSALLYQTGIRQSDLGLGAAYSCVVLVVVIAFATLFTTYLDRLQARQGRGG